MLQNRDMRVGTAVLLFVALLICAPVPAAGDACCTLTVHVVVSEDTGPIYMSGNIAALGPWRPDGQLLQGEGSERSLTLRVPKGFDLEYKFTLGAWEREALHPSGTVMPNFRLKMGSDAEVRHVLNHWKKDPREYMEDWRSSGVQGTLVYWPDVKSEHLDRSRHVVIWLPPGYDAKRERGYPVLYMHDGQNLFDPRLGGSNGVVWDVDDAVVRLVEAGTIPPLVVVGVFSTSDRLLEYSPWHGAPAYARFLIEELMPRVNAEFNTLAGPRHTGVMGSSFGGLASFYLVTRHPEVFGSCGCMSSSFPLSEAMMAEAAGIEPSGPAPEKPFILGDLEAGLRFPAGVRYWFDFGTIGGEARIGRSHEPLRQAFLAQGWKDGVDFVIREYPGAIHNESSWRERLEDPLTFMFGR